VVNVYGESTVPSGLSNVTAVAAGYFYSMALRSDGIVIAWGQNFTGQTNIPPGLTNVVAIATPAELGGDFSAALTPSPLCAPGFPDNFECRPFLSGSNISFSVSNVGATSEPGEPLHVGFQDAFKSLWYSWTAPFSGGAMLNANTSFRAPCMAVYAGSNFASFTEVASNTTAFYQCRVVFNAVAGSNYQIALDGTTFGGTSGEGTINFSLVLSNPPANDLFANRALIPGTFYETSGSFVGATQEPGEPAHTNSNGNPTFQQTLWWTWTAPTSLGVSAIPVSLIADGVSFVPNIGVYTGTVLSSLTNVSLTAQTNGMTRFVRFMAVPGTSYQIALAGLQSDPVGVDASPRIGNYYFRFSIGALVLSFAHINPTNNGDNSISFGADLQVTNYGSASSAPLRVLVSALSGVSVLGQDSGFATNAQIALLTTNLSPLAAGQGLLRRILANVPPPVVSPGTSPTNGVGYGAYGQLQEQVGTNWFTLDQTLVLFGNWPDLNGNQGPGGGVIRLDPGLTGAGFNPLTSVNVLGPSAVTEGASASYFGRARYANAFQFDFTNTLWISTIFTITNGLFTTGIVTSNTPATLVAQYSSGGFIYTASSNITILNLPPPSLVQVKLLAKTDFNFQVMGVTNRKHVIEAAVALTNLVVWTPLSTNILTNGVWNFLESISNTPQRFYRARELP